MTFADVYAEHAGTVRRILFRLCHPNDLDDLVQIVFIRVHEHLDSVREKDHVRAWIYRIAVNAARDRMRQKKRGKWTRFFYAAEESEIGSPQPSVQQAWEDRETAKDWLSKLSPKLSEVLVLYSLEELEVKEIAAILEIPEGTVKSRLHQAREILRPIVQKGVRHG